MTAGRPRRGGGRGFRAATVGAVLAALATAALDAAAKRAVVASFLPGESRIVIPHLLYLTYVRNARFAFGLGGPAPAVYVALGLLGLAMLALLARAHVARMPRERRLALALAYGTVAGGGTANIADRALHGAVVDFIDVRVWPVFNVADVAVTIGLVAIAVLTLARKESTPALSS
jgi:signal peptidase II